ncbi:MAG: glycerol-3-phosphate dehydrogenase/oxidase [Phormidesmis sp.]
MKRNIPALIDRKDYDLIIIGGGINGAACAWDAVLRGLNVALLERRDFGWATSSNSSKIAHSGLRYLQHADFKRMRESIRERNLIHQRAPHLINSQPYLLPVYGHGIKGRETMGIYIKTYDLFSLDRQWFKDPARRIPGSFMISKEEVLKIAPDVDQENLTGGAIWYEGQMHNTERLLLSYVRAAAENGADIANNVEVTNFIKSGNTVTGDEAKDLISGETFSLNAKAVVNAAGPWIVKTLNLAKSFKKNPVHASKAFTLITRKFTEEHALTFPIRPMYEDRQAVVDKKSSLTFAIPWRGLCMIGSLHLACTEEDPAKITITEEEIQTYIDLINEGYPAANLTREDVRNILWGIVPADEANSAAPKKHYEIFDHAKEDQLEGLISVAGVKYTTARDVAQKSIDIICKKLGKSLSCTTDTVPLWGGDIELFNEFKEKAIKAESERFSQEVILHLIETYGTKYPDVLAYLEENPEWADVIPGSPVLKAEVIHAVRDEMATHLTDVVLRRTDLGSLEYPGEEALRICAKLMAKELGWSDSRINAEVDDVANAYIVIPNEKKPLAASV